MPCTYWRRTRWPGPLGAIMATSMSPATAIWPKWIEKPCANISIEPGRKFGAISSRKRPAWMWSGTSTMTMSAWAVASATVATARPSSEAVFHARESGRAPTTTVGPQELLERMKPIRRAHAGERDRLGADVHDLGLEYLREADDLRPPLRRRRHLDHQELELDRRRAELGHLQHVDQLVQLLGDLVDGVLRAVDPDRDAAAARVLRRPDREGLDVEAAAGEEAGAAREHAGPVLHEHAQRMHGLDRHTPSSTHSLSSSAHSTSMMSVAEPPAGTIG